MNKRKNLWKLEKQLKKKIKKEIKNSPKILATPETATQVLEEYQAIQEQKKKQEEKRLDHLELIKDFPKHDCNSEYSKSKQHDWKILYESEDKTEIIYHCYYCNDKHIVKKKFNYFKPTLMPHTLKRKGPAEYHPEPRKYSARAEEIHEKGDIIQKNEIYKRCLTNGKIKHSGNPSLEEKSEIVSQIIPPIVLDECVDRSTLMEKIQESGYDVHYLGRGLDDLDHILPFLIEHKAVLVTEDKEFFQIVTTSKLTLDPIFIERNAEKVMDNLGTILRYMKKLE